MLAIYEVLKQSDQGLKSTHNQHPTKKAHKIWLFTSHVMFLYNVF